VKNIEQYLFNKYNKLALDKKELANELGVSVMNINRRIMQNDLESLPYFVRMGKGKKARYLFPISSIAQFLNSEG